MSYQRNQSNPEARRMIVFILVSLLILILGPLLLGGVGSWFGARFAGLFFHDEDNTDICELRSFITELMLENAVLREEAMKAELYRILLGITRTGARHALAGRTLYRSEGLVSGVLVIDRGTDDGVIENSVCLSSRGLIGIVVSAGPATCEVIPITSPMVSVSCMTYPSGAIGILQSTADGELELVHVDVSSDVSVGDQVLTNRFGGVYPDGILVGWVSSVSEGESGLAMKLSVIPAVEFRRIGEVLILLPEGESPR